MKDTIAMLSALFVFFLVSLFCGTALAQDDKDAEINRLTQELKKSKRQINQLEEELAMAGDGSDEEEVADEVGEGVYPWTGYIRRLPYGVLGPKTATIGKGQTFARFSHVGKDPIFTAEGNAFHDFLGIEDSVKIGVMFGYGLTGNWDVMFQRTNGGSYGNSDGDYRDYDLWDVMTKIQLLNEMDHWFDCSIMGGGTYFMEENENGRWAGNAAFLLETSMWRFRMGSGVLYTSLSTYEANNGDESEPTKRHPDEVKGTIDYQSGVFGPNHTVSVPITLSLAVSDKTAFFGEAAYPVDGYETGRGPSMAAGYRISTSSHTYSLFFSNTSNNSYNSTFTGGYRSDRLDIFGFSISIFF